MKFNSLTVLRRTDDKAYKCGTVETRWICRCDCGEITEVSRGHLKSGKVKTCGCSKGVRRPGGKYSIVIDDCDFKRIRNIWRKMVDRCNNRNNISFPDYGGRGIKVCKEWIESPLVFYIWSKNHGYKKDLTIDRIDVNGNYEPDNCRWISLFDQQSNKRNNVYIECVGEKHTIAQWSRITGLSEDTIRTKNKKGLPAKKVLDIEVHE